MSLRSPGLQPEERMMNEQQNPRPKAGLHRTVREIASNRAHFGLSHTAMEYLRLVAERVSPGDLKDGRTPWCYERVDDLAHALSCDPRTIRNIEKRLEALGLVDRKPMANGHRAAKRCLRTGELLWAHGISLAPLLERRDEIAAIEQNRADRERAYRTMRQKVHGVRARLKETLAAAAEHLGLADLCRQMWAIYDASPARVTRHLFELDDLTRVHAELMLAVDTLIEALDQINSSMPEAGDNDALDVNISDTAEINCRHKYRTTPLELYSCNRLEINDANGETGHNPEKRPRGNNSDPAITPKRLLDLAPDRWTEAISGIEHPDWSVIGFVAAARRAELGVSEHAWQAGVDRMGPRRAAICLAILDANRNHPTTPVRSVGGAFVAMTRRDATGELDLQPSLNWIAARHGLEGCSA